MNLWRLPLGQFSDPPLSNGASSRKLQYQPTGQRNISQMQQQQISQEVLRQSPCSAGSAVLLLRSPLSARGRPPLRSSFLLFVFVPNQRVTAAPMTARRLTCGRSGAIPMAESVGPPVGPYGLLHGASVWTVDVKELPYTTSTPDDGGGKKK